MSAALAQGLAEAMRATGAEPDWPKFTAEIATLADLDEVRQSLSKHGALTAAAMAAIRDRQDQLHRGRG